MDLKEKSFVDSKQTKSRAKFSSPFYCVKYIGVYIDVIALLLVLLLQLITLVL